MARKVKDDTPEGGWLGPNGDGFMSKMTPTHYAEATKVVRGKRVWAWKPVTEAYLRKCEKRKRAVLANQSHRPE